MLETTSIVNIKYYSIVNTKRFYLILEMKLNMKLLAFEAHFSYINQKEGFFPQ